MISGNSEMRRMCGIEISPVSAVDKDLWQWNSLFKVNIPSQGLTYPVCINLLTSSIMGYSLRLECFRDVQLSLMLPREYQT